VQPDLWWRKTGECGSPKFGPRNPAPRGGEAIAVVGPMQLSAAKNYAAVLSYAVMRPGDNSRVHTHPGPEGWYVLAGGQCSGDSGWRQQSSGRRNHDGATEYSNGTERHWYERSGVRSLWSSMMRLKREGIPSDWKPSEPVISKRSRSRSAQGRQTRAGVVILGTTSLSSGLSICQNC